MTIGFSNEVIDNPDQRGLGEVWEVGVKKWDSEEEELSGLPAAAWINRLRCVHTVKCSSA